MSMSFSRLAPIAAVVFATAAHGQVQHKPKQEVVPDFGKFVPEQEAMTTSPWAIALERVTCAAPWGRGITIVDGELLVLSRGRHRYEGGPDPDIVDNAGTLWKVDTSVSEPVIPGEWAGEAVRNNATVFAGPTSPPFYLYTHDGPPEDDILMARPYCALAFDETSRNLFVCAYSGAELSTGFRKHATDAVYRYDLRNMKWHIVEQHDPNSVPRDELKAVIPNVYYPHHDPNENPPPHGWPNGANGCLGVGEYLYVPAKDNHMVVQYDLDEIRANPDAGPPNSRPALGPKMIISYPGGEREMEVLGPNGVAHLGDHLYISYRTSSIVVRVNLNDHGDIVREADGRVRGELIAVFEPWDKDKKRSGNLYDIDASQSTGELFVSMGTEGRVWRFKPDPDQPFYGNDQTDRSTTTPPFLDMVRHLGRKIGCNNIYVDNDAGYLYVSSRSNDRGEGVIHGTIYRAKID